MLAGPRKMLKKVISLIQKIETQTAKEKAIKSHLKTALS